MNNSEKVAFAKILFGLAEIFGGEISETAVGLYFNALAEFTLDDVSAGISSVVKSRVYKSLPMPAEIIQAIDGGKDVKALSAWDAVLADVRRNGKRGGKFENYAIESAVRMCGGFDKICNTEESELRWIKKEFIEAYAAAGHRAFRPAIGWSDRFETAVRVNF